MIYIQTLDTHWSPGSDLKIPKAYINSFDLYVANEFVRQLKLSIVHQTYTSKWKPLSHSYLLYKRRRGLSLKTWEATSQLKTELKVYLSDSKKWIIGWDTELLHKETKYPIYLIAKHIEFGTRTMPPRPLFREVFKKIKQNLRGYFARFMDGIINTKPKVKPRSDKFDTHPPKKGVKKMFDAIKKTFKSIPNKIKQMFGGVFK